MINVFVTGFPGFIAGRLVEKLAAQQSEAHFYLLVQPAFAAKAQQEIERIAARTQVSIDRFKLFQGDITHKDLGLSASDADFLRRETTDVFHLAAAYDLAVAQDLANRVNVNGTANVNRFAAEIKNLNRYNYVSTCYVAGKRTGRILETELEHDCGFRNFYEETKYKAEILVENLKPDLPVTIYRPSVVVGDSNTGETTKYDGVYSLILYLRKSPALFSLVNIGNDKVKLNLVPVDFIVNGIAALSQNAAAVGKTIQLADPAPLSTAELFNLTAQTIANRQSVITLPTTLSQKVLMLPITSIIAGLPQSGVPYFFIEQTYDTQTARELLAPHQIACPPFASYIKNLIAFVEAHPQL